MMKTTVSEDDDSSRRCGVRATEIEAPVSAFVSEPVDDRIALEETDTEFDRLKREQDRLIAEIRGRHPQFSASDRLTREQLHERATGSAH